MGDPARRRGREDAEQEAGRADDDGGPCGARVDRAGHEELPAQFDDREHRCEARQGTHRLQYEDCGETATVGTEQLQQHPFPAPGGIRRALRAAAVRIMSFDLIAAF
ncbi:hypothetical protein SSP35_09_01690 [Streptomyces sp. NBRC 110611]|nr:hypothetical protein SSP35_09_01690 [Streptomyces sp. NBRC 110611]